jgi:hypothetical protein
LVSYKSIITVAEVDLLLHKSTNCDMLGVKPLNFPLFTADEFQFD